MQSLPRFMTIALAGGLATLFLVPNGEAYPRRGATPPPRPAATMFHWGNSWNRPQFQNSMQFTRPYQFGFQQGMGGWNRHQQMPNGSAATGFNAGFNRYPSQ